MSEADYLSVLEETPKIVAARLGIDSNMIDSDIKDAIKRKDDMVFLLMDGFQRIYKEWWEFSKKISPEDNNEMKLKLRELISSRDEIRNSLLSYLNSKYDKTQ